MNEQELWRSARTLRDLGALTARRLEGDIAYQPGYMAPCPDDETAGLIEDLAALNRAGFFTEQSQPGEIVGDWCQRAFVAGYADEALSFHLMAALCPTELVVVSSPPGTGTTGSLIVVTREGFLENTWVGTAAGVEFALSTAKTSPRQPSLLSAAPGACASSTRCGVGTIDSGPRCG